MKIYFCGSIRGGRQDSALYTTFIDLLKEKGCVLTEHIAQDKAVEIGREGTDSEIWQRDTAWLRECDIVIAECTQVSLGVGYELAYAESLGKTIHVFFRGDPLFLSAMIAGNPNFSIHYYQTTEELADLTGRIFPDQGKKT